MTMKTQKGVVQRPSVTIVRRIQATPAKIWAALTTPALMIQWWGPDAGPTLRADADVRPGGRYNITFRVLSGAEYSASGVYRDIIPEQKLSFTWELHGKAEPETLVTFLLKPLENVTEFTLIHEHLPDEEQRQSHNNGWMGWMDKLAAFVGAR
jgi:uncharacterized protein YndB with AHSA1/START domain